MKQEVLERRLDLLRLEGNGLLPAEIVKELSQKYQKSERNIYYDHYIDRVETLLVSLYTDLNQIYQEIFHRPYDKKDEGENGKALLRSGSMGVQHAREQFLFEET